MLDPKKRMEFSRIHLTACPTILNMAAAESQKQAATIPETRRLVVTPVDPGGENGKGAREEVLLVKWRGRSYMHCSWERASDIQRLDISASNIARNKLRKFYQNQEAVYGANWKQILEEERMTAAAIHSHGKLPVEKVSPSVAEVDLGQDGEYFSPQCLEVERILACDENEMNMDVLAKQRALNIREEMEEVGRIESEQDLLQQSPNEPSSTVASETGSEMERPEPWDPEDNVRYVVKWKGLPYAEITWEYWRDIKRSAVDETEDFWYRQKAPDLEEVRRLAARPHPHIKDFKKLQESPVFGISKRSRPVAKLEDGACDPPAPSTDADTGFRLRSYQLEGVNWLLFNWWNRRSCILGKPEL